MFKEGLFFIFLNKQKNTTITLKVTEFQKN